MNRIYQGRVTRVEISDGNGGWKSFDNDPKTAKKKWQDALWRHHELFQDAVNYYTLGLAAMAGGLRPDSQESKAVLVWREQVRESWLLARRKAVEFSGPHANLAKWLDINKKEDDSGKAFDACARALLKDSPASKGALAKVLLQILEEVDKSDLNQFCVSRLPFLCSPYGKLDATPKNVVQQQETRMLEMVKKIHEASARNLADVTKEFDLGCFVTQMPKEKFTGKEARAEAQRLFESACKKVKELKEVKSGFYEHLERLGDKLELPRLGRKPKGAYPLALVFKLYPVPETWESFKSSTGGLLKRANKIENAPVSDADDFIAEARTEKDLPVFDYFTNRVFLREPDNDKRAVWFEFDLAAFIEAIKAPHRYFQDTLKREKAAESLRKEKLAMEGRGVESEDEGEEDDEGAAAVGFEGDRRINLLRELVTDSLGYVAETENPDDDTKRIEYTIQERTLRGFDEIREKWRRLAEKNQATQEKLLEVLAEHQTRHRDDFGSATLYRALVQPEFHPVWRDPGTEKWHATDPLKAWRAYKELCFELEDKERPIRFTPAHPEYSPRYFIFPKKSEKQSKIKNQRLPKPGLLSRHEPGQLSFTGGIVLGTSRGLAPTVARVHYAAPRLCRDNIRSKGDNNLYATPWLQPMMAALGLDKAPERVNFANCRVTLQPQSLDNIQLTFPVEVTADKLIGGIGKAELWNRQFNLHPEGDEFYNASLRWPHEKQPSKPPQPWHEKVEAFRCLSVDLGQREAGAFAIFAARCDDDFGLNKNGKPVPARFIGKPGDRKWHAALERSGLFRLPGEDARLWRAKTELDSVNPKDSGRPFDFRDELHGSRGRKARDWEADETAELMRFLEAPEEDKGLSLLPDDWREALTFPEQNDKLLVAMRRYQSRIARLHRWCWFLKSAEKQQDTAHREILECDDLRLVSPELKKLVSKTDPRASKMLETQLCKRLDIAQQILVRIANRALPLRGRSWKWESHPRATAENPLHHLTQNGPGLDREDRPVWIRGQRGLSMKRIEQIEELRKRLQSLNQTMRRKIGEKPPIRRDESVPDPCPDLLEKLDNIKEQRVNQTAHMLLAEALGLRLAPPPANKKSLLNEKDLHGVYEKIINKRGEWVGPVDFIVIEDLSRYRASQGRAPRENSRLMKWCHRAVRDKLKELCEVFGLPVLETPAAYSSRFCARSGVPGFRATEVTAGFTKEGQWAWLAGKKDEQGRPMEEAKRLLDLDRKLTEAQTALERKWTSEKRPGRCPKHTLLVPLPGGPTFVPVAERVEGVEMQPAIQQADKNAAASLGLRAIADPRLWSIHPRLRTKKNSGDKKAKVRKSKPGQTAEAQSEVRWSTREKRKFGEAGRDLLIHRPGEAKPVDNGRPNFFADYAGLKRLTKKYPGLEKEWTTAEVSGEMGAPTLVHGKSFWGMVKAVQWDRIDSINEARLATWRSKRKS
ncbi:MAG: type V CRISPR-associated protein Cas12b [Candidatus Methylomirabilis sp.]|nr:type V CRISPR-associated protein Cas12b [Deltaproteobacteria bacterium]